ncbi:cell wall glucanase (Scw4) [Cordyceps militaris]|uniref:Cell wall glucanase (Scw4) n=1 Tax=Cordyceps militaris TaxID=73501 RepID=A0A2H4SP28_CORMI|nr:cell wall glucanase (Scw4) [Cordyceps militaris]
MTFRRTLAAALVTVPFITCHPTREIHPRYPASETKKSWCLTFTPAANSIDRSGYDEHSNIVVFNYEVESAVHVPEVVVWDDNDEVVTSNPIILRLPPKMASNYVTGNLHPTAEPTITTTMTSLITQTVTVTVPAPTHSPSGIPVTPPRVNSTELFGVSYTPYRADHGCKSQEDIDDDIDKIAGQYSVIRVYGTDCDQVAMMYKTAKKTGMKLFLGIWDPSTVEDEAHKTISGINGDWNMVHTVSVGNELVNNGQASPSLIINAMRSARSMLRAAGYQGPVVTVDTFMAVQAHPELCDASDYCAMNAHPFFDSTTTASYAGRWLVKTIDRVKSVLSTSKRVIITETGWPTKGLTNGVAVPGLANQKMALDSIQEAFAASPGDIILLSAFNDLWKTKAASTFDADQFWGINGAVANCDL